MIMVCDFFFPPVLSLVLDINVFVHKNTQQKKPKKLNKDVYLKN